MSRWFRHYAGMMRDDKLVSAAIKAKQPVERVVWVWGAILESAAEIDDGGRFSLDTAEVAYFLRADEADIGLVVDALVALGRIDGNRVVKWGDRQFTSDRSADRQAKYRERKRAETDGSDKDSPSPEPVVTSLSRHGDAPETETELDTKTEITRPPVSVAEGARDFDEIFEAFPRNPTSVRAKAEAAFSATKAEDRPSILAAARRFAAWFAEDCAARKRTVTAGLKFAPHLANWLESDAWRDAAALAVKSDPSAPVLPMVKLNRLNEPDVWAACERLQGKRAPTSDAQWSFPLDIVVRARAGIASHPASEGLH